MTELRKVRLLPRSIPLDIGLEVWRHPNPHVLRARFAKAVARGEVEPTIRVAQREGVYRQHAIIVKRLKPERTRWPLLFAAGFLSSALFSTAVWLLWESRYVLLGGAVLAIATIAIASIRGKRHCPGC